MPLASAVIKHLVAEGHSVVGAVRDAKVSGENVAALGAKVVEVGSLADAAALQAAFTGVDGVFHMAAVHPQYGFEAGDRDAILKTAVDGTTSVIAAAKAAGVGRIVVTSSLAAIECGNDEGVLTEATWSRPEVYDSSEKLTKTQWATHYTYVKSKVEQEKAAVAFAAEHGLDLRVVVPGNLCVGPIASKEINGTMTRLKDIVSGTNTLKGAADLAIVHVNDVVEAHAKCMTDDAAKGRYLVAGDMVQIEEVFSSLKQMYPQLNVAALEEQDIASGVPGAARKIDSSRTTAELGLQLKPFTATLKDAVDSLIDHKLVVATAA